MTDGGGEKGPLEAEQLAISRAGQIATFVPFRPVRTDNGQTTRRSQRWRSLETITQFRGSAIGLLAAAFLAKDSIPLPLRRDVDRAQRSRETAGVHNRFQAWRMVTSAWPSGNIADVESFAISRVLQMHTEKSGMS